MVSPVGAICYYSAPSAPHLALYMRVGVLASEMGPRWAFLKNKFKIRISKKVKITPRCWIYRGHLGNDNLPSELPHSALGILPITRFKRYTQSIGRVTTLQMLKLS